MQSLYVGILALSCTISGLSMEFSGKKSRPESYLSKPGLLPSLGDIPLLNRKIYQGYRVTIQEHPYIVSIRRNFAHYLVGTMLSKTLVVTVAHPLYDVPITELAVVAGENYADRGSMLLTVLFVVMHTFFDPITLLNDVALLQLHENPENTFKINPILGTWNASFNYTGKTGFVTGWGRCDLTGNELCFPRASEYHPNEYQDPMLKTVKIALADNSTQCDKYCTMEIPCAGRHKTLLCVGEARKERPTAPCMGVPGAPLVVEGRLLGLASWGFGCGYSDDLPLIYTDIRQYDAWIRDSKNVSTCSQQAGHKMSQIFEATKSYKTIQWMERSRGYNELRWHKLSNMDLQALIEDQTVLSKFAGRVYDVRDCFANGRYAEKKQILLSMVHTMMKHLDLNDVVSTMIPRPKYDGFKMLTAIDSDEVGDSDNEKQTTEAASAKDNNDYMNPIPVHKYIGGIS